MAPPLKLTPAARSAIAKTLARGGTYAETCQAARLGSTTTLERYLMRARKADQLRREGKKVPAAERPFLQLYDEMREAEADVEFDALEQISQGLAVGADLADAAAAAGVSMQLLDRLEARALQYQNRLEDGERLDAEGHEYLKLFEGYRQGLARAKITALASINRQMSTDWHAAAWWLERRHPEEFASPNSRRRNPTGAGAGANMGGRPMGASSAPDRPTTADEPPPRIRLRQVR